MAVMMMMMIVVVMMLPMFFMMSTLVDNLGQNVIFGNLICMNLVMLIFLKMPVNMLVPSIILL
jgi:hypothetical protein